MKEIPEPDAIVALVEELTSYPWPKNQSEKDALFKRLGWSYRQQFPANSNSAGDVADHFQLQTREDDPPIVATSRELGDLIEAIHVDLRMDSAPPDPEATQCFDAILSQLTNLHGEPSIPWHGQRGLRKMWNVNGVDIESLGMTAAAPSQSAFRTNGSSPTWKPTPATTKPGVRTRILQRLALLGAKCHRQSRRRSPAEQ